LLKPSATIPPGAVAIIAAAAKYDEQQHDNQEEAHRELPDKSAACVA
jgi:hypothetical protein